jgi:hypothetical protein
MEAQAIVSKRSMEIELQLLLIGTDFFQSRIGNQAS